MKDKCHITVEKVTTETQLREVHRIRELVFIIEQKVPSEREYDEFEGSSIHYLARMDGQPVGCGRIRPYGKDIKLERLAVLKEYRKRGIGKKIMNILEKEALKYSPQELVLHSQVSAMDFYRSCGYTERGDIFLDAGIDHMEMTKEGIRR